MQIIEKSIESIIPYEFNNRRHNETQVNRVANSIKEYGFNQPIVIDENNIILVGHGRHLAALKLGLKTVPVLIKSNLSETKKKAYRILDNKLQNDSEWDFDNLTLELDSLEDEGFDLEEWGLDDLRFGDDEEAEVTDDDFDPNATTEETYIKLGDLIELGKHRVLCGDNKICEIEGLDENFYVITDPPYGIDWETDYTSFTKGLAPNNKFPKIHGDNEDFNPKIWIDNYKNCLFFGANCFSDKLPKGNWLIWDKRFENGSSFLADAEAAWYNGSGAIHIISLTHQGFVHSDEGKFHPTQKPVKLLGEIIKKLNPNKILDPFLGSGTTLIAAEQLGRICYGMEISPRYCQVIIERYQKYCKDNNKPFECKINGEPFKPSEL